MNFRDYCCLSIKATDVVFHTVICLLIMFPNTPRLFILIEDQSWLLSAECDEIMMMTRVEDGVYRVLSLCQPLPAILNDSLLTP